MLSENLWCLIEMGCLTRFAFYERLVDFASIHKNHLRGVSKQAVYAWFDGARPRPPHLTLIASFLVYGDADHGVAYEFYDQERIHEATRALCYFSVARFRMRYEKRESSAMPGRSNLAT